MSARGKNRTNEKNAARSELHSLLAKKLIARYGHTGTDHGAHSHPVNQLIQAEVDLFMHNHAKVQAGDLSQLERAVRSATKAESERQHHYLQHQHTLRKTTTPRSTTPKRSGACTYRSSSSSQGGEKMSLTRTNGGATGASLSQRGSERAVKGKSESEHEAPLRNRSRPRPSTAGSGTSRTVQQQQQRQHKSGRRKLLSSRDSDSKDDLVVQHDEEILDVPIKTRNEWLILETYQQVLAEAKQAEEERRAKTAIQLCKQGLDEQIQRNLARSEKERRDAEDYTEQQRRVLAQHQAHQEELKGLLRKNLLEEKCERASQILSNERRRERERRERRIYEARTLDECRKKLAEEKEEQLQKRKQIAESLREMDLENVAKLAMREKQKLVDAEEDKRLMKEYRERLDREQAERTAAHQKRMQRYEKIGNQWAETGAGKAQHDKDLAEERRVLAAAAIKAKADNDREIRDKKAIRMDRLRCLEDNKRLMYEKAARKKAEEILEAKYAQQIRLEDEMNVAKDMERKREIVLEKKAYARKLKDQMRATKAALRNVQMTDTERQINGDLLRKLQGNKDLQDKICRRLLQK